MMYGTNTSTAPTPPMTPSHSSERGRLSAAFGQRRATESPSQLNSDSIQPVGASPTVKVNWKTR